MTFTSNSNHIRMYFDEKLDDATRALLKSRGFRWQPKAKAWQRQFNGNGQYAACALVKALGLTQQEPPAPEATEPETISLVEFIRRAAALIAILARNATPANASRRGVGPVLAIYLRLHAISIAWMCETQEESLHRTERRSD